MRMKYLVPLLALLTPVSASAECPNGQQAYYTSGDGITATENCRKVYDHGGNGVAWTGNLGEHLTPVLVDGVPLVIDDQPIVTASGANNGAHQHTDPVVKGINGVAVGDGAMVGEWVPTNDAGTPDDPTDDVAGHYRYVDDGTAVGAGSQVTHKGSTALGAGARSSADNQVTLGTAGTTIRAEGITSQASKDRQTGPVELVTSDAGGNLATDGGAVFNQIGAHGNTLDAHTAMLSTHSRRLGELERGLAVAMAMPDAWLSDKERFAVAGNIGGFGDEMAFGLAAIVRIDSTWSANAKAGVSADGGEFGWTLGARAGF
jgi:hypothetical protein